VCVFVCVCMYVYACMHLFTKMRAHVYRAAVKNNVLFVCGISEISNLHSHAYDKFQVINEVQRETRPTAVTQYA
jgi:hypothetical protein